MDAAVAINFLKGISETRKEQFTPSSGGGDNQKADKVMIYDENVIKFTNIMSFFVSVYAAYLSWTCNTVAKVSILPKIIYALFAFIFGTLYVIFYGIFKRSLKPCKS